MLVLHRRPGEAVEIGEGIRLVVLSVDRRGVRLGIEAPPEVGILRAEVVAAVAAENLRAATPPAALPPGLVPPAPPA